MRRAPCVLALHVALLGATASCDSPPAAPPQAETPTETRPTEIRQTPTEIRQTPTETRPAETRPVETRPAETRPAETRPAEPRPAAIPALDGGGAAPARFSFVVVGDTQYQTGNCTSRAEAIPPQIRALEPDLVLHTGDLMNNGGDRRAYARFTTCFADVLERAPFFPTMGNHDAGYLGVRNYRRYLVRQLFSLNPRAYGEGYARAFEVSFDEDAAIYSNSFARRRNRDDVPSGVSFKTFYAFRHKNALFISFEQGTRWWTNTPTSWVERQLRRARRDPGVQHIFVYLHHPLYSSFFPEVPTDPAFPGAGLALRQVRTPYEELFRRYDVTIVFSGHAHTYDRFYVPDDGHQTRSRWPRERFFHDGRGIHYIVTGGGGGALNPCRLRRERSYRFLQRRACVHHVTRVQVRGRALDVSAIRVWGSRRAPRSRVFDSFSISSIR